jgi:hypothetical protein
MEKLPDGLATFLTKDLARRIHTFLCSFMMLCFEFGKENTRVFMLPKLVSIFNSYVAALGYPTRC